MAKRAARQRRSAKRPSATAAPPPAEQTIEGFRAEVQGLTPDAVRTIRDVLRSKKSPAVRLKAAKMALEFAWGKPAQSIQHTFPGEGLKHKVFHLTLTDTTGIGAKWLAEGDDSAGPPKA